MKAELGPIISGYELFANKDEVAVDYLIQGPGCSVETDSQAKANKLISIANERKDCVAVISPHRANVVDLTNTTTQTDNVIRFFSALSSSSYGILIVVTCTCMIDSIISSAIFHVTLTLLD